MTGKHLGHAYIRNNKEAKPEGQEPIPAEEVTIAELVKQAGYATAAIGKWGLGPVGSTGDPLRQGFDLFFGYNCPDSERCSRSETKQALATRDGRRHRCQGGRIFGVSRSLAPGSSMICSAAGSHLSLRPVIMAMLFRWQMLPVR